MGKKIFLTPHSHYDYLWCDTPDGMGSKNAKLIKEALLIMRKHENYRYIIDSVMACEYFRINHPEMWEELQQRVKERKIELIGGDIVAPDTLLPNGESLVRQFLYGCRYFKKHFGIDSKIAYLIDSFGQTPQLPQILKKAGFEFFIFVRGARNRRLPQEFWWKSFDGSKILTHWMYSTYTYIPPPFAMTILPPIFPFFLIPGTLQIIPQNFRVYEFLIKIFPPFKYIFRRLSNTGLGISIFGLDMGGLKFSIKNRIVRSTTDNILILNGTDNLPPSTNILDAVDYYNKKNKENKVIIAIPSEFHSALKKSRKKFGIVENYEFLGPPDLFPGTFSNRPKLKQQIRFLENQFYLTELFSTLSNLLNNTPYPKEEITKAIKRILCCDFHDGITGVHIDAAYDNIMKQLKLTELQLKRLFKSALSYFIKNIDTSNILKEDIPLLIFNPLSWERTSIERINLSSKIKEFIILNQNGKQIPYQKEKINEEKKSYIFLAKDIPPIGYALYSIRKNQSSNQEQFNLEQKKFNILTIENNLLKLNFKDGKLISIYNKKDKYELNSNGKYSIGGLRIHNDRGDGYYIGRIGKVHHMYDFQLEVVEKGPVRTVVKLNGKLKCKSKILFKSINEITQYIIIPNFGDVRIDFITIFYNNIRNIRIQACFPIPISNPTIRSEIPYGFIERNIEPKVGKSWKEINKHFEHYDRIKPVINWMDFSNIKEKKGVSIMNYGIPEYEIGKNKDSCYLTLMRSTGLLSNIIYGTVPAIAGPFYRIPKAYAIGDHTFRYSLYLYNGDFPNNLIAKKAQNFNIPLIVRKIKHNKGKLGSEFSLFLIEPKNFIVSSIKKPEDGNNSLLIRLLETSGKKSTGVVKFNQKIKNVIKVNLLELPIEEIKIENDNSFTFGSNPQEILSFIIKI